VVLSGPPINKKVEPTAFFFWFADKKGLRCDAGLLLLWPMLGLVAEADKKPAEPRFSPDSAR
jgi:hypothetical protein